MPPKRLTDQDKLIIFRRDKFVCQYCGIDAGVTYLSWRLANLSVDHVSPRAGAGDNSDNNLTTACHNCNLLKGSKPFENAQDAASWLKEYRTQVHRQWYVAHVTRGDPPVGRTLKYTQEMSFASLVPFYTALVESLKGRSNDDEVARNLIRLFERAQMPYAGPIWFMLARDSKERKELCGLLDRIVAEEVPGLVDYAKQASWLLKWGSEATQDRPATPPTPPTPPPPGGGGQPEPVIEALLRHSDEAGLGVRDNRLEEGGPKDSSSAPGTSGSDETQGQPATPQTRQTPPPRPEGDQLLDALLRLSGEAGLGVGDHHFQLRGPRNGFVLCKTGIAGCRYEFITDDGHGVKIIFFHGDGDLNLRRLNVMRGHKAEILAIMNAELPPLPEVRLTVVDGEHTSLQFRFQEEWTPAAMVEAMRRLIAATRPYLDDLPRA